MPVQLKQVCHTSDHLIMHPRKYMCSVDMWALTCLTMSHVLSWLNAGPRSLMSAAIEPTPADCHMSDHIILPVNMIH